MKATPKVILDDVSTIDRSSPSWYGRALTRGLISAAPDGVAVEAWSPSVSAERESELRTQLAGVTRLTQTRLPVREMRESWLHSVTTLPFDGIVHATSLLAPLRRRERGEGGQTVVTVHGVPAEPSRYFTKALRRAWKHADGIVAPTSATADAINEIHDFGDRIRVIPGAAPDDMVELSQNQGRVSPLGLPDTYVIACTERAARSSAALVLNLAQEVSLQETPIVVIGPVAWEDDTLAAMAVEHDISPGRIIPIGEVDDTDFTVAMGRAAAYAHFDTGEDFGLAMHAAFRLGTPVVHASTPVLDELANGASLSVSATSAALSAAPIADGINRVLNDPSLADRLAALGADHATHHHWTDIAEQVWNFHAEL
ncbi:MAG: glycosyltransferase [Agrococcus casei]|uniref:glycosyltransferase n=1 Tax=Agrococcus casei TaxID=343512 RepID=UPI003F907B6A